MIKRRFRQTKGEVIVIVKQLRGICILAAAAAATLTASSAQADFISHSYGFTRITNNGTENPEGQIFFEVRNFSGGEPDGPAQAALPSAQWVSILVRNVAGGMSSSIGETYFEDGTLLDLHTIVSGPGTTYIEGASPPDLPGGEPFSFVATTMFSAEAAPGNANGINPGEWVEILFTLKNSYVYSDVLAAIAAGQQYTQNGYKQYPGELTLRFGIHVRSIGLGGESEGFINSIPLPAPFGLALAGLAGVVIISRRKRKAAVSLD